MTDEPLTDADRAMLEVLIDLQRGAIGNLTALYRLRAICGEHLRTARESLGLTQTEVATALGVDLRTYQRWESGEVPVPRWVSRRAATMIHRLLDEDR